MKLPLLRHMRELHKPLSRFGDAHIDAAAVWRPQLFIEVKEKELTFHICSVN